MILRKALALLLFGMAHLGVCYAQTFCTQSHASNIKTVQCYIDQQPLSHPIIELEGNEQLLITFDELSYEARNINYSIIHCNSNWAPSHLAEIEYIEGYNSGIVEEYYQSINTTVLYTNYQLRIPNDDFRLKLSGNYAVQFYEDGNIEHPIATACFSVVESLTSIEANIKGNTDIEINKRYQQLDFTLEHRNLATYDAINDFKLVVMQNNRRDNLVTDLRPTYTSSDKQTYCNNKKLIFEGGNEYRTVDFSSEYTYGRGVERIVYDNTYQHVILATDENRGNESYLYINDANGKYVVNRQFAESSHYEADYMWVHFTLKTDAPLFAGSVYLLGDFAHTPPRPQDRLDYNASNNCYEKAILLKQGGINYQYLYIPKGGNQGTLECIEGSFWQTQNEYQIFVYFRPRGERYDRLVGWKLVK